MATSVLSNTILTPAGAAVVGARVVARLLPFPGFRESDSSEIADQVETDTNATGLWSLTLERNADITPDNTFYEVTEYVPSGTRIHRRVWNVSIPSSNVNLLNALITPPTANPTYDVTGTPSGGGVSAHGDLTGVTADQHHAQLHAAAHAAGQADVITPAAIGAEAAGAVTTHVAAADPHTGYVLESLIDAAADLIVGTADNTVGRLAKGSALDVLRVNAGATALEWAAGGGSHPDLAAHDTLGLATQSELDTHAADTTSVHGIADTATLATATSVATAVSDHSADTTSVHGIADTSVLATATSVATAVSDHSADTTSVHGIADTSALETTTGSAAKVSTHAGLADPHTGYILESLIDAAADLIVGTADNTVGRLAKGSGLDVLRVNAGATALEWAAPSGGGGASIDGSGSNAVAAAHSGDTVTASSTQAIAIGLNASANTGAEAIAIGGGVSATAAPNATAQGAIAIGASNDASTAGARSSGTTSIAIGSGQSSSIPGASATANNAIAMGVMAAASGSPSLAIGPLSVASAAGTVAIGDRGTASESYNVAIGAYAKADTGTNGVALGGGQNATSAPYASAQGAIAMGGSNDSGVAGARASATNAVAIGAGDASIAGASAAHANAIALGKGVATTTTDQVNIGAKRLHLGGPATAPADADLIASQISFWIDEAGSTLKFKVKYAAGTVKSGSVAVA